MIVIKSVDADQARACLGGLVSLLCDAVGSGASIGFLPPLPEPDARNYWHAVFAELDSKRIVLLVALDSGEVAGTAQVHPAAMPNGSHRAEVAKLFVHSKLRRQGIGRSLMAAAESSARDHGRTLLVLDTRAGDASEQLYRDLGYVEAGRIPGYARSASGELHSTVFFYKQLS